MSGPAVTKHLNVLEKAGLIRRGRDAQRRPCRLEAARLKEAADYLAGFRRFWDGSLDRLEDYLQELRKKD
jgi:DNA-binding transcriptional ArsR family regulator